MTLSVATLEAEFRKLIDAEDGSFIGHPTDKATATANWATAYDNYITGNAEDLSGDVVATKNKAGFQSALTFATSTAAAMAAEWRAAFEAYWTGATFAIGSLISGTGDPCPNVGGNGIFGSEISSVVTVVSGVALEAAIVSYLGSDRSYDQAVTQFAALFDSATKSGVTVLISGLDTTPPGSGGPLPITNTCTVF